MTLKWLAGVVGLLSAPVAGNQWVTGSVDGLWEYSALDPAYGIFVTLGNVAWGSGSPSNGASQCNATRLRLAVGYQGVTSAYQDRMYALLLNARALGQKAVLYVDTQATAPYCAIQIVMVGQPLP